MKQATLDILDASLREAYEKNLKKPPRDHFKLHQRPLAISPKYWKKWFRKTATNWTWTRVRYEVLEAHLQTVTSNSTGIYYFYVRPEELLNDHPQFVFYVGIVESNRPLKTRLRDYLNLNKVKKRDAVHQTLEQFYPCVWVAYSLQNIATKKLEAMEEALHGFFQPWANDRDFPAEIQDARKAWRQS